MKPILGLLFCVSFAAAQTAPIKPDETAIEKRNKVLQENFSKFPLIRFESSNGVARVHRLDMKANRFD